MGIVILGIILFFAFCIILSEATTPKLTKGDISEEELNSFGFDIETNVIQVSSIKKIGLDVSKNMFFIGNLTHIKIDGVSTSYYKMSEMINLKTVKQVELIQDSDVVSKASSGSVVTRAAVGGVLAGGVGAIVGGNTAKTKSSDLLKQISFRFKSDNMSSPYKEIIIFYDKNGIVTSKREEAWKLFGQIEIVLENIKN